MKKKIKEKWIAALKSGNYKQAQTTLKRVDGKNSSYCCLGVLCDIYAKEKGIKWKARDEDSTYKVILDQEDYLPKEVVKWAGLKSQNPRTHDYTLAQLNDEQGLKFSAIAKQIETHF